MKEDEPNGSNLDGRIYTVLAFFLAGLFLLINMPIFVPAHRGVDQNGYLVGGKMLARHGSMAYRTLDPVTGENDPLLFVGRMWVGYDLDNSSARFYPKYPIGLPALYAAALNMGGEVHGVSAAYWVSPVSMALGVLAVFFLVRLVAPPLYALLASALMCASPLVGWVTHNPNSHASNFLFAAWGLYFLFAWWKNNTFPRAFLAGFLTGYAATIRYTDVLLILPILLVVYFNRKEKEPTKRSIMRTAALIISWAAPVGVLLAHNMIAFGSPTGYEATNESVGFSWEFFTNNWDNVLYQLNAYGMLLTFPLGLAGMVAIFWWSWRKGLVIVSWVLPTTLVYSAYYWSPEGLGFARFFLVLLPALLMSMFWLMSTLGRKIGGEYQPQGRPSSVSLAVTAFVVLVAMSVGMRSVALRSGEAYLERFLLDQNARILAGFASPHSVVVSEDRSLMHHLQFVSDYRLYGTEFFSARSVAGLKHVSMTDPAGWQPQQRVAIYEMLKDCSQRDLDLRLRGIIDAALDSGETVLYVRRAPKRDRKTGKTGSLIRDAVAPKQGYITKVVARWPGKIPSPYKRICGGGWKAPSRASQHPWVLVEIRRRQAAVQDSDR